jgi:hypothetical protein
MHGLFQSFGSIHHQSGKWRPLWQIGTRNSKSVVGIAATAYLWIQDMEYDQYRPAKSKKNMVPILVVLFQLFWPQFITSGKWRPLWQTGKGESNTVVGIEATAYLWIQDMDYDQYRPATPFDTLLVPIHGFLKSLWLNSSQVANEGLCDK